MTRVIAIGLVAIGLERCARRLVHGESIIELKNKQLHSVSITLDISDHYLLVNVGHCVYGTPVATRNL